VSAILSLFRFTSTRFETSSDVCSTRGSISREFRSLADTSRGLSPSFSSVVQTLNYLDSLTLEDRSETSTALPPTLENLPDELISSIVLDLDEFVLPPLSKRLLPFHRSSLYRTVSINLKQFDKLYWTLRINPQLSKLVESLSLEDTVPQENRVLFCPQIPSHPRGGSSITGQADAALAKFTNLTKLSIRGYALHHFDRFSETLELLPLGYLFFGPDVPLELDSLIDVLPDLKKLSNLVLDNIEVTENETSGGIVFGAVRAFPEECSFKSIEKLEQLAEILGVKVEGTTFMAASQKREFGLRLKGVFGSR